ncbi:T-cell surface glycoprotein CD1b1-like [Aquarana catesbeiana]|uniref:T-cell surface glycoprotein CD1b1-like n=1 Tax=Aquarana catesbeiana TaxID=8400 RepID=UPI003CC9D16F
MKALISSFIVSLLILLSITAAGSVRMTCMQNIYFSNEQIRNAWASLEMEDIEIGAMYNDTQIFEFKQSWAKANLTFFDQKFLEIFIRRYMDNAQILFRKFDKELGIKGSYLIQGLARCSSLLDDIEGFTYRLAKEGEDLVSFNVTNGVWEAGNAPHSQIILMILKKDRAAAESITSVMMDYCPMLAALYSTVGKETFSRKIQPQVYITKKTYKFETELICMVTGFYPKPINVSLWKEDKKEDVMSTVTLPNGDGTYQITVLIIVNFQSWQSVYCQVEHSSLNEPLIVHLDKEHHTPIGLVIGITVAVVCVVGLVCFLKLYKQRSRYTSIIGLTMDRLSRRRDENY